MANHAIEQKKHTQALWILPEARSTSLGSIVMGLGKLAVVLGEPMTPERQALMAEALSDLPAKAVLSAIDAWQRGDKRHLSAYQQDSVRVGVFFPKPAELRELAQLHMRADASTRRANEFLGDLDRWRADAEAHPENYGTVADVFRAYLDKQKVKASAKA